MHEKWRTLVHSTQTWWQATLERGRRVWRTPQGKAMRYTGSTAVLAVEWNQRLRQPSMFRRAPTRRRLNAMARLAYYVLPLPPTAIAARRRRSMPPAQGTSAAVAPRARLIANPASGTLRHPMVMRELE